MYMRKAFTHMSITFSKLEELLGPAAKRFLPSCMMRKTRHYLITIMAQPSSMPDQSTQSMVAENFEANRWAEKPQLHHLPCLKSPGCFLSKP